MKIHKDPEMLRLVDGQVVLADGSSAQDYLRQWAITAKVGPDEPVNMMRGDGLAELRFGYFMYQYRAA